MDRRGQALTETVLVLLMTVPIGLGLIRFIQTQWTLTQCSIQAFRHARLKLSIEGSVAIAQNPLDLTPMGALSVPQNLGDSSPVEPLLKYSLDCHSKRAVESKLADHSQVQTVLIKRLEYW